MTDKEACTAIYNLSVRLERGYFEPRIDTPGGEPYLKEYARLYADYDHQLNTIISATGRDVHVVRVWARLRRQNHPKHFWVCSGERMQELVFVLRLMFGYECLAEMATTNRELP